MGNRYVIQRSAVTPVAGEDLVTIVSAANRRVRVAEVSVSGAGASSAAQRLLVARSTGGLGRAADHRNAR